MTSWRAILLMILIAPAACVAFASLTPRKDRVEATCQAQGSEMAVWQCQQYYARNPEIDPGSPVERPADTSTGQLDPGTRAALIGVLLSRPQPYYPQPYVPPAPPRPIQTTCMHSGMFVDCTSY